MRGWFPLSKISKSLKLQPPRLENVTRTLTIEIIEKENLQPIEKNRTYTETLKWGKHLHHENQKYQMPADSDGNWEWKYRKSRAVLIWELYRIMYLYFKSNTYLINIRSTFGWKLFQNPSKTENLVETVYGSQNKYWTNNINDSARINFDQISNERRFSWKWF